MPAKNKTKVPQRVIEEAVKRHMAGEPVSVLAKHYKISRAGFYLWAAKYKRGLLAAASQDLLSPKDAEKVDKRTLIAQIDALRAENARLKSKVVALMLKSGEI